jgi:small basic protein (TIGR04137 family)
MTIHKSLKVRATLARARNVWKRVERVIKLEEEGKFAEGRSVFGLPKVKTRLKVKAVKAPKKEAAAAPGAEGAAAVAAAPGAGAKPVAGAKPAAGAAKPAAAAAAKPAAKPAK